MICLGLVMRVSTLLQCRGPGMPEPGPESGLMSKLTSMLMLSKNDMVTLLASLRVPGASRVKE